MIRKIFDMIETAVNPLKVIYPDPQSISNNAYNQWGPPVNISTGTGICQYQQYGIAQQANAAQNFPNTHTYAIAGTGNLGLGSLQNSPTAIGVQSGISSSTGMHCNMAFTDANGYIWSITVDQAFAYVMAAISQAHTKSHQLSHGGYSIPIAPTSPAPPAPQKMVDGDFSFDEMAEAEIIIQELEGGQKSEGCTQA